MKLSILGSTGSIGTQALEVVRDLEGIFDIDVIAVSGNSNIDLLESQIREFNPKYAAVSDEQAAKRLEIAVADTGCKVILRHRPMRIWFYHRLSVLPDLYRQ